MCFYGINTYLMDIDNLKTFRTVVAEGSMTTAASKRSITQPAVSQQIRQLEKEFGVKLLNRNMRKVQLTVQGQILYENANRILNLVEQTKSAIQAISLDLSGEEISAITLNSLGLYLISPIIVNFLRLNDDMKLFLQYGHGQDIIRSMQRNTVDVAIVPDLKQEYGKELPQFKKIHLFKDHMYFVGSGRDKTLPKSMPFKDIISRRRLIHINEDIYPAFQNYLFKRIEELGLPPVTPSFQSDNVGTLKRVIEFGLGWGFLPAHSIRKQLRAGRLSVIQIEDIDYSVDINLYYQSNPKKEKIISTLTKIIQKQAEESV